MNVNSRRVILHRSRSRDENRSKIGAVLRAKRESAGYSLRAASKALNGEASWSRLWQIESGLLPYRGMISRLCSLYSTTPEQVIREATGQTSLDLVATFFGITPKSEEPRVRFAAWVTAKEKDELGAYLAWIRFRAGARTPG